jgi:hypothetical protein
MPSLRSATIRLAYENRALRPYLLETLVAAASSGSFYANRGHVVLRWVGSGKVVDAAVAKARHQAVMDALAGATSSEPRTHGFYNPRSGGYLNELDFFVTGAEDADIAKALRHLKYTPTRS